ncbi:MAG: ATPase, partial [Cyanobacteria bacterium J083]
MNDYQKLKNLLLRIDGSSYKAYKDIKGSYQFDDFVLIIDRVQSDPFAAPSKFRVIVNQTVAKLPEYLFNSPSRRVALQDYLTRQFAAAAHKISLHRGSGKSGLISIAKVTQEVLNRTTVFIDKSQIEVRFVVGLPAHGRRILGRQAVEMLCIDLPEIVDTALKYEALDAARVKQQVEIIEDADWLRQQLINHKLVAFIPNGAILPRASGVDPRPLKDNPQKFQSPPSLEVEFNCPNRGLVKGMGIGQGITLIVGGGYHGKSTLLQAVALGVYNHIPGDGRELVVTEDSAVKIRAEDGRSVVGVDISPFINHLPLGKSTVNFSTPNASGSTSQAANIIEALEVGSQLLLIDEDTAATNFMIRDRRMQKLIGKDKEPITPLIDKIQQLYKECGVSTMLVIGGSGDYFDVADTVIAMEDFLPKDVTEKAKAIAQAYPTMRENEGGDKFGQIKLRIPLANSIDPSSGKKTVKLRVRDTNSISLGREDIDLGRVEQIVDPGQLQAIAEAIVYAKKYMNHRRSLAEIIELVMEDIE